MGIKATQLHLDPYFGGTLQKQIQQLVSQGILAGRFPPGEKMPSSRMLAQQLGVSRVTVTLAYAELVAGDYLVSRGRSGHFISENAPHPPDYKLADTVRTETVDWDRALGARYTDDKDRLRPPDWRGYEFPFIYGQPDSGLFDHDNWRRCALEAHGRKDFEEVTADSYEQDDPKLVEYIVRNVLPRRGISARPVSTRTDCRRSGCPIRSVLSSRRQAISARQTRRCRCTGGWSCCGCRQSAISSSSRTIMNSRCPLPGSRYPL